ncbi:MAG: chemotaxis protein CheW [Candidatus Omnitrophota bacterium]|nr:chemotaxis protein CheW [Candidatus Omnitrophota bacterium]
MQKETQEEKKGKEILTFRLLNEELGLDISCVREVLRPQEIHALPRAPDFIDGVINLRGHIIAVIDLRKKFNIKAVEDSPKTRIIICKIKKFIVGIVVDSVNEVISLSKQDIHATPEIVSIQIEDGYISGIARVGERVITLLDLEKVLTKEKMDKLSELKK